MIVLASLGLRSSQSISHSLQTRCTKLFMSVLPSLVLVWPSNCGLASFTEMIAARPSRMSSPESFSSALSSFLSAPYLLSGEMMWFGPHVCIHSATVTHVSCSLTSVTAKLPKRAPRSGTIPADDFSGSDLGRGTLDESTFLAFSVGSRVRHPEFGLGKIMEKSGTGDSLKVVVLFDNGQWKKLLVKYAGLERL